MSTLVEKTLNKKEISAVEVESVWNEASQRRAANLIAQGETVGLFMGSVCTFWGKGDDLNFFNEVVRVKGEKRKTKQLSIITNSYEIVKLIDPTKIPAALQPIFLNPAEMAIRFGALCFLQLPVRQELAHTIAPHHLSYAEDGTPIMMGLDPYGNSALELLSHVTRQLGVKFLTGSSLNASGQPEIVEQVEGIEYCHKVGGVPLFLIDPLNTGKAKGSLPIIRIDQDGPKLIRDGFIPTPALEKLIGMPIDTSLAQLAIHPRLTLRPEVLERPPYYLRRTILEILAS